MCRDPLVLPTQRGGSTLKVGSLIHSHKTHPPLFLLFVMCNYKSLIIHDTHFIVKLFKTQYLTDTTLTTKSLSESPPP